MDQQSNQGAPPVVPSPEPSGPPVSSQSNQSSPQVGASSGIDSQVSLSEEANEGNYIINVGRSMVDLLTDISVSDVRKKKIADEMRISILQVEAICNKLLEKIDGGELTEEDLAFLITAPVADSPTAQNPST